MKLVDFINNNYNDIVDGLSYVGYSIGFINDTSIKIKKFLGDDGSYIIIPGVEDKDWTLEKVLIKLYKDIIIDLDF